MRFVHTADWQIGMKAEGTGPAADTVRNQRIDTARRVIEEANAYGADFILIAGDLFEHNAIDRTLIRRVTDVLADAKSPVYIIPGNHDPFVPGSVWSHPAWAEKSNLHILTTREPIELPGGTLYPCPLTEKHSMADPTAWIKPTEHERIRIGIAHGTVEGVPVDEPDYPIPRDAANQRGLDYLALGHWHSTSTYLDPEGAERMAYSGTHEPSKFGERDSGNILKIEIDAPGSAPKIERVHVGVLSWMVIEHEISAAGDFKALRDQFDALPSPGATLLDIRITGLIHAADQAELDRIREIVDSGRYLHARVDDAALVPTPDDDEWLAALPPGVVREVAEELRGLARPEHAGERPEGATAPVAGRALLELYRLVQEHRA